MRLCITCGVQLGYRTCAAITSSVWEHIWRDRKCGLTSVQKKEKQIVDMRRDSSQLIREQSAVYSSTTIDWVGSSALDKYEHERGKVWSPHFCACALFVPEAAITMVIMLLLCWNHVIIWLYFSYSNSFIKSKSSGSGLSTSETLDSGELSEFWLLN